MESKTFANSAINYYEKAIEALKPVGYFVDDVLKEMATPGGIDALQRYRNGEISAAKYDTIVRNDIASDVAASALGSIIGTPTLGAAGAVAGGPAGAAVGANIGAAKGAAAGYIASRAAKAIARATTCFFRNLNNSSMRTARPNRVRCTADEQRRFLEHKLKSREWRVTSHKIGGKKAYHDQVNDVWYTQVKREKNDFEVWRVTGKRAKHQGAIECKQGTLYESSSHPDTLFE